MTSALSFSDIITRVAETMGVAYYGHNGQGKATVPVDEFNLDLCKRIVNDGIRSFIASAPPQGWRWMNRIASIQLHPDGEGPDNINEDPSRYLMPQFFNGEIAGPITYDKESAHAMHIEWCDESFIRERQTVSVPTTRPYYAATRPFEPKDAPQLSASRRHELILYPNPVAEDTVLIPYRVHFDSMQLESGQASEGTATSLTDNYRTEPEGYFVGWTLTIMSGAGVGGYAEVIGYDDGVFTFSELSNNATPDDTSSYKVEPQENLHPAGERFDDAILCACKAEAEKQVHDLQAGHTQFFYEISLPNSWRIDSRAAPRTVGNLNLPARASKERTWNYVYYEH